MLLSPMTGWIFFGIGGKLDEIAASGFGGGNGQINDSCAQNEPSTVGWANFATTD